MTKEQEQAQEQPPTVRFNLSREWVTGESNLIKRLEHLEEGYVDLSRRARAQMSELELFIEGVEELQRTRPTYEILKQDKKE